jgi:hypothetical protein
VRCVGASGVRHGARCCQIRPPTLDLSPRRIQARARAAQSCYWQRPSPRDAEPLRSILAVVFVFSCTPPSPAAVTTKLVRWRAGQQEEGPDATTFGGVVKVGGTTARDARRRSDPGRPARPRATMKAAGVEAMKAAGVEASSSRRGRDLGSVVVTDARCDATEGLLAPSRWAAAYYPSPKTSNVSRRTRREQGGVAALVGRVAIGGGRWRRWASKSTASALVSASRLEPDTLVSVPSTGSWRVPPHWPRASRPTRGTLMVLEPDVAVPVPAGSRTHRTARSRRRRRA